MISMCGSQLIEIAHIHAKAEGRSRLGITCYKLLLLAIQIKVKGILRIHIN
jgi:hypothetical protein